jgi:hypothetical protein
MQNLRRRNIAGRYASPSPAGAYRGPTMKHAMSRLLALFLLPFAAGCRERASVAPPSLATGKDAAGPVDAVPTGTLALVSRLVADERQPVRFLYREDPDRPEDSGWRLFSGFEPDGYEDSADNVALLSLAELAAREPQLAPLLDAPVGSVFERVPGANDFAPVTDWAPRKD